MLKTKIGDSFGLAHWEATVSINQELVKSPPRFFLILEGFFVSFKGFSTGSQHFVYLPFRNVNNGSNRHSFLKARLHRFHFKITTMQILVLFL